MKSPIFTISYDLLGLSLLCGLFFLQLENRLQADPPPSQGVAVLDDGRVFQGAIEEVPGGYRVRYPGGSAILPFNQVSVTSASLAGAYEALRSGIQKPSADIHLSLAEWCLANGLYAQAEAEVHAALKLEPLRSDAQQLLKHVDAVLHPQASEPATTAPAPPARNAAFSVETFLSPAERSGAGLTRETQRIYNTRIQPLLLNKCGNAACHGSSSSNRMILKNVRADSPGIRSATEENLNVLFQFIDFNEPGNSPLLTKPLEKTPHHQYLFSGRQQRQALILETWIRQLVAERSAPANSATPAVVRANGLQQENSSEPQLLSAERTTSASPLTKSAPASATPGVLPRTAQERPIPRSPEAEAQWLERIRKSHRPDPFDPEEFNRMMHTRPESKVGADNPSPETNGR